MFKALLALMGASMPERHHWSFSVPLATQYC